MCTKDADFCHTCVLSGRHYRLGNVRQPSGPCCKVIHLTLRAFHSFSLAHVIFHLLSLPLRAYLISLHLFFLLLKAFTWCLCSCNHIFLLLFSLSLQYWMGPESREVLHLLGLYLQYWMGPESREVLHLLGLYLQSWMGPESREVLHLYFAWLISRSLRLVQVMSFYLQQWRLHEH